MRGSDQDLDELERLFGQARADYRALRHRGAFPLRPKARPRFIPRPAYAIAATVLVALATATLATLLIQTPAPDAPLRPSRLAISAPPAPPLSLRPDGHGPSRLTIDRPRLAGNQILRLPRRPSRTNG